MEFRIFNISKDNRIEKLIMNNENGIYLKIDNFNLGEWT